jgi:hypothetical protein
LDDGRYLIWRFILFIVYRKEDPMRNTCCALGMAGEYSAQQFVVTGVVSRQCGRIGGEGEIMLK